MKLTQNDINEYVINGGDLFYLSKEQISAIPQEIVNQYVANGRDLSHLTEEQISAIPQEIVNQYAINGGDLHFLFEEKILFEKLSAIPQEIVNQYAANSGDLEYLTEEQVSRIPQEIVNQLAAKGESLEFVSAEQREAVPQKIINQRIANGIDDLIMSYKEVSTIPQEIVNQWHIQETINQYVLNGEGEDMDILECYLSEEEMSAIPQEIINQRAANGRDLSFLSESEEEILFEKLSAIPQEIVNQYAANGGWLGALLEEQSSRIPQMIISPTNKAKEALILYTIGKLKGKDLPRDVFVNYSVRESLLEVIKIKTKMHFNEICKTNGFSEHIPSEIVSTFDERLQEIEGEVSKKTEQYVKDLSVDTKKTIKEIKEMGW